ncbi:MAG: NINE protein [Gemmatimonadales bacterium]|nr:MAG: NINE protein [Gemmatimonadales bacterium]
MITTERDEGPRDTVPCPICAVPVVKGVKKCRHCGEWIERNCEHCNTPLKGTFAARGVCAECAGRRAEPPTVYVQNVQPTRFGPPKSKAVAILFALTLGAFGAHRFYLGRPGSGILYLLFSWTLIPALIAVIEVIVMLLMDPAVFRAKYGSER